jgi:short-subunit dehydrogenase
MLAQGTGHIVNMASLAGLVPAPMAAPYGTTKHAVVGLSMALRAEAAARGVRVSVVCPGFIDTEMPQKAAQTEARKFFYPVERLAADVLHGVDKNRAFVVTPRGARILWRIQRTAPGLGDRIATRFTARVHRGAPPLLPVRILSKLKRSSDRESNAA